ncbi:glycosyltransferase family 2 protein [Blastococcus tunisiensis]|uniref:Glycosyltransferase, GT2 family n=1 Tax=Blastococcus tunisiensis TaxID=1798228 RepID=A0A1I2JB36_9ACTN|nr:glycosyltransferase family 2 protein [Blastococcus sp. DSM 46838]SFF51288.1 Glycosyltransferase, GT2 family [Blastococcus sp. DSM 46838]
MDALAPLDPATLTISVVICAYTEQRWDDVLAAVGSVRAQRRPALETILVVDHNPALLARLRAELTDVRVVENGGERGLSGGKNTGVALAAGDVVAFLDDDAVAEPDWLGGMAAGYGRPDVVGVGGMTLPLWETGRPRWFPEEFDWVVGCTFVGREPGEVRNLLGGNASFRREVFDVVGGFPTGLGRTTASTRPLGGEETEFCIRVTQQLPGAVFLYEPGAVIWHRAPAARERFAYFRSRCYAEGLSKALVTRSVGVGDGLAAERAYTAVTLRRGVVRGVSEAVHGKPAALARTGAILVGLSAATWGYAVGRVQTRGAGRTAERLPA